MPLQTLDRTKFFDDIVAELHQNGSLKTFEKPLGEPGDRSGLKRRPGVKGVSGTIHHIGDENYSRFTRGILLRTPSQLTPQDIGLKSTSIRKAIQALMPGKAFVAYLDHFRRNLDDPKYEKALEHSLGVLAKDLKREYYSLAPESYDRVLTEGTSDEIRFKLGAGLFVRDIVRNYPELALSFAIYHAAHSAYIDELEMAVRRSSLLSADEKENGVFTLTNRSFEQFEEFVIFPTLLPLAVFAYEHPQLAAKHCLHPQPSTVIQANEAKLEDAQVPSIDHERMAQAITTAWDILFAKQVMVGHFKANGIAPQRTMPHYQGDEVHEEPSFAQMTCPAKSHLQDAQKDGLLEDLYHDVVRRSRWSMAEWMRIATQKYEAQQER